MGDFSKSIELLYLGHWSSEGTPVIVLLLNQLDLCENKTFPDRVLKTLHASMKTTMHEHPMRKHPAV